MIVTHNITAVPVGVDTVRLYKSSMPAGIYVYEQGISVSPGQTSITFDGTVGYYYKFSFYDSVLLLESSLSVSYYYIVDAANTYLCNVYDYIHDGNEFVDGVTVTITVQGVGVASPLDESVVMEPIIVTSGDPAKGWSAGYWCASLYRSSVLLPSGTTYLIKRQGTKFKDAKVVVVPDLSTVPYVDLDPPTPA